MAKWWIFCDDNRFFGHFGIFLGFWLFRYIRRGGLTYCFDTYRPFNQSVANIFFGTEYEYEYIRNLHFGPNTNMNIFRILQLTEYEYEYIHFFIVDRIRIFEYSNTNTNIRIYNLAKKHQKLVQPYTGFRVFLCMGFRIMATLHKL